MMDLDSARKCWKDLCRVSDGLREAVSKDKFPILKPLTFNQLRMVKLVHILQQEMGRGTPLRILAERLAITPAAASEMVDSLVRKKLLKRETDPVDRRAVSISLGEEVGKNVADGEYRLTVRVQKILESLDPEERETFLRVLQKIREETAGDPPSA